LHINVDKDPNNAYVSIALTILAEEDKNEEGHAVSIPVFGRIDADDWPRDGGRSDGRRDRRICRNRN
jgi:hypothetical protein